MPPPGSEPARPTSIPSVARLPAKLTPAQKQKVDRFERGLLTILLPELTTTSSDRHQSAATAGRKSLAARPGRTAKHTLTRFEERPHDRDVTKEFEQAQKSSEKCDQNLDYIDSLRRPKWDIRGRKKSAKPSLASVSGENSGQPTLPPETLQNLENVAHHAFPKRMDLPVLVCDIRRDDAIVYRGQLKDIESCTLVSRISVFRANNRSLENQTKRCNHSLDVRIWQGISQLC